MSLQLQLTNTKTRQKEPFKPIDENTVYMYVCGITPYDSTHIGHARSYINFDFMVRALQFLGYKTVYIRNYTDIDDKLLDKARAAGDESSYLEIAEKYIKDFQLQMGRLNCQEPNVEPRATQSIPAMIKLISTLLDKGFAYSSGNDVYFDINAFEEYGALSGKKIDDLISGARVGVDENKKNAGDFVLWKGNDSDKFWETPFGYGRPGWHIECSAMIDEHCPDRPLDIHGGGYDLIFPHHENEIAQSKAANGYDLANWWVHNAFVNVGKDKMSKSLGNTLSLIRLFEQTDPMIFRLYVMQHAYLRPLEFCPESLRGTKKPLERLIKTFGQHRAENALNLKELEARLSDCPEETKALFGKICAYLADDLNMPAIVGEIFKNLDSIQSWNDGSKHLLAGFIEHVLGIRLDEMGLGQEIPAEVTELMAQREAARKNKDFETADKLRDQIKSMGFDVSDVKLNK